MKNIKFLTVVTTIIVSLLGLTSCTSKQASEKNEPVTDVARFIEDYTVSCNVDKYNIVSYSFNDAKNIKFKNIWVTRKFLDNKEHLDVMYELLENNFNILIQEYKFTAFDSYELFKISNEKRAMKTSRENELIDVSPPLQRFGVILFKYKNLYYAPGINSINNGKIEDLLIGFTFDKEKMIGN